MSANRLLVRSALAALIAAPIGEAAVAADSEGELQEVIVTATRREGNLQQIPISITAVSSKQLDQSVIENPQDLPLVTPGLVMGHFGSGFNPFIRGIGSNDVSPGQEAGVTMYVDGVYQSSPFVTNVDFNNIERVEVLKGPQGTLFGRNSTGGAIQIVTKDPSHTPMIDGSVSYGDFNTTEGKVYGTTGISDTLAADLAVVYYDQKRGFGHNITTGAEINARTNTSARSKWLYTPTDTTRITLAFDYTSFEDSVISQQAYPGVILGGGTVNTGYFWNATGDVNTRLKGQTRGVSAHIDQEFDPFNFTSISAYRSSNVRDTFDNDFTPAAVVDVDENMQYYRTFTEELQVTSKPSSPIKWIGGAFFMLDKSGFGPPVGINLIGSGVGGSVAIINVIHTKSYSLFGETTIPLGDTTNLTVGARWTHDLRELVGYTNVLDPDSGALIVGIPHPNDNQSNSKPTWRVMLDHHFLPDIMGYASISKGFKSGNFNAVSGGSFQPETVTAYELGSKMDLLGRRLRLDVAGFYYRYNDMQVSAQPGNTLITTNAGKSELDGAELSGQALLGHGFSFDFGASYLHTKFLEYDGAVCYVRNPAPGEGDTVGPCNLAGSALSRAPEFTFSAGPQYQLKTDSGSYTATASYYHSASYYWQPGSQIQNPAYNLVNLRCAWEAPNERYGAALFMKNASNARYATYGVAGANGDAYAAAPPRTVGAEFNFKFQ